MRIRFPRFRLVMLATAGMGFFLTGCSVPQSMIQHDRSMLTAPSEAIVKAQTFESHAEYANVYVAHAGEDSIHIDIDVNGQSLGGLAKGDFMRLHVAPGKYKFKNYAVLHGDDEYLNALFDLEVNAGAVVLLECHPWMTKGVILTIPQDPVLQEWRHCSTNEITERNGVKACNKHYAIRKITKAPKGFGKTFPASACYLSDDRSRFRAGRMVNSKQSFFTNEGYEFTKALQQDSVAELKKFIAAYPRSQRVTEVKSRISELEVEQAQAAFAQSVQETLERDRSLPLEIRKDKYLVALTDQLTNKNYSQALVYFEALEALHVELSPTFDFLWGDTLLKSSQPRDASTRLHRYVAQAGSDGAYYQAALKLINKAEQK